MVSKTRFIVLLVCATLMFSGSYALSIDSDTLDPASFETGEESHLFHNVNVGGVSADNRTDMIYFSYDGGTLLDPKNLTSNITVSRRMKLLDRNGDGVKETVSVGVNPGGGGRKTGEVTVDTGVKFRAVEDVNVTVEIEDSEYGKAQDNDTLVFEGNTHAIKHRQKDHTHQNNFGDALACPENAICLELPQPYYYLQKFLDLF